MKTLKYIAAATIATLALAWQAQASLIDLGLISPKPSSPIGSPQNEADFIETYLSLSYQLDPTVLPDLNNPGGGSQSSYLVSWNLTGTGNELNYILVKDGSVSGTDNQLLYRLYQVTADQLIIGSGTVMIDENNDTIGDKAISHITFLGSPVDGNGNGNGVPDSGSTAMLLGTALSGLGAVRRLFKA